MQDHEGQTTRTNFVLSPMNLEKEVLGGERKRPTPFECFEDCPFEEER